MPAVADPVAMTEPAANKPSQQSTYLLPTLRNLFTKSLANTLSKCSYPAFSACFPTPAAKKPDTLKTVWKQIVNKVETKALAELEAVCQERELDAKFAELEEVLKDAKNSREQNGGDGKASGGAGLHALPPSDLFRATLATQLVPIMKQLEDRKKDQQDRNKILIQELLDKRKEIESIVKSLEGVVSDVEGANKILYAASKDLEDVEVD